MAKLKKFDIRIYGKPFPIMAEEVINHKYAPEVTLFIHRLEGAWRISEMNSGLYIAKGKTKKEALEALSNCERTKEQMLSQINKCIEKNGVCFTPLEERSKMESSSDYQELLTSFGIIKKK